MVWGVDIIPHDLDIFASKDQVKQLLELFSSYKANLPNHLKINGIDVEILELDFSPEKLIKIPFADIFIPINSLEDELEFYQTRAGKEEVVDLIKKHLAELNPKR